jgi:hypothetical protein
VPDDDYTTRLNLTFPERRPLSALGLANFVYDLNLLYAASYHWISRDEYQQSAFWGRWSSKLPEESALSVERVSFASPGVIDFLGIAGVILTGISAIANAGTWWQPREKTRLEVEKLKRELGHGRGTPGHPDRMEPRFDRAPFRAPINRLRDNELQPSDISISIVISVQDRD